MNLVGSAILYRYLIAYVFAWTIGFQAHATDEIPKEPLNCEAQLATDIFNVRFVLLSHPGIVGKRLFEYVQNQIIEALPEGVEAIYLRPDNLLSPFPKTLKDMRMILPSAWVRDWFPMLRLSPEGEPYQLSFRPMRFPLQNSNAANLLNILHALPKRKIDVSLDWGNVIVDEKGTLISSLSNRLLKENKRLGLTPEALMKRIENGVQAKRAVWLPELPQERTKHVDMMASYLGNGVMVVADSREPERKAALDEAARRLEAAGYVVHRLMNAGPDNRELNLTYTNALVVNGRVLVPVYSSYMRKAQGLPASLRILWQFYDSFTKTETFKPVLDYRHPDQALVAEDDQNALEFYAKLGFEVYPIHMNGVVDNFGMVHCLTRCLPKEITDKLGL